MIQENRRLKRRKKEQIKISNINEFKDILKKEGYSLNEFNGESFKEDLIKTFNVDSNLIDMVYKYISGGDITYRAKDIRDFIDYIEKIILFENEHNKLCKKISEVKKLNIHRVEYDRVMSLQDNVENILKIIEELKSKISRNISEEEEVKLENLEKEIGRDYLYSKDIELLKKMVITSKEGVKEKYNKDDRIKTISIEIPYNIDYHYITAKKGSVEYHQYLNSNIPRIKRLIKNLDKYMIADKNKKDIFNINQSEAVQDTINIAVATYNNKEFKAISGSNNIVDYCIAPVVEEARFESCKVNKLGKLGTGYKRVNDSEKKILEEIHKQIESKEISREGELILYSKWEPCPSCYFVISQFCKSYPNIKVQVKYRKKYGE